MIAGVCTSYNEADIIAKTVGHLLAEGVDHLYFADASTDETPEILAGLAELAPGQLTVIRDDEHYHFQPKWINMLASHAAYEGHDWILPFDADEFWYPTDGTSIKAALDRLSPDVRLLHVRAYQQVDWDHREIEYRSMGKVAFRYEPSSWVANGNHTVYLPSGGPAHEDVLDLREWQFRSFEHLARKCHERVARLDPTLPYTEGTHQRVLAVLTDDELRGEWERMQAVPAVYDPIPSKGAH